MLFLRPLKVERPHGGNLITGSGSSNHSLSGQILSVLWAPFQRYWSRLTLPKSLILPKKKYFPKLKLYHMEEKGDLPIRVAVYESKPHLYFKSSLTLSLEIPSILADLDGWIVINLNHEPQMKFPTMHFTEGTNAPKRGHPPPQHHQFIYPFTLKMSLCKETWVPGKICNGTKPCLWGVTVPPPPTTGSIAVLSFPSSGVPQGLGLKIQRRRK